MSEHNYLGTKEIAKKLNVPENTIYYWVSQKKIPYTKMGKHNRFLLHEVMEFFQRKTQHLGEKKEPDELQT